MCTATRCCCWSFRPELVFDDVITAFVASLTLTRAAFPSVMVTLPPLSGDTCRCDSMRAVSHWSFHRDVYHMGRSPRECLSSVWDEQEGWALDLLVVKHGESLHPTMLLHLLRTKWWNN